jgi:hypothetical protein
LELQNLETGGILPKALRASKEQMKRVALQFNKN